MKTLRFNKEEDKKWYVDLPKWTVAKTELEMVCGANDMLETLSDGKDYVILNLDTKEFENATLLKFLKEEEGGGWYLLKSYQEIEYNSEIWLCEVAKFIFGELPKEIYFSKV